MAAGGGEASEPVPDCPAGGTAPFGFSLFSLTSFLSLFIFERERERTSGRGAEREREAQNLKQDPGSEPSAQSPTWGSNSQAVRSRPEPKSDA